MNGSSELAKRLTSEIDRAAARGSVLISAISVWELATLASKKRLSLSLPIHSWVDESLSKPGISLLPLSPDIAVESSLLPGKFPGDPADRIIIASTRMSRSRLITRDAGILEFARGGYIEAVRA